MEQGGEGQGFESVNTESVSRDNEPWRRITRVAACRAVSSLSAKAPAARRGLFALLGFLRRQTLREPLTIVNSVETCLRYWWIIFESHKLELLWLFPS